MTATNGSKTRSGSEQPTLDEAMRRAEVAGARLLRYPEASDPAKEENDAARYIIKAAIASLAADEFVLVPREATQEMLEAVPHTAVSDHPTAQKVRAAVMENFADDYKRALSAAPKPGDAP